MIRPPLTRLQLAGFFVCPSFYAATLLILIEALLSAAATWLVIKVARDIANDQFVIRDLLYILGAEAASYVTGAVSWIFSERAGVRAFGLYMFRFARDNRNEAKLLFQKDERERVEPFITGETFSQIFTMMYEIEHQLQLFLGLAFNAVVLGVVIDQAFPIAYGATFVILAILQWSLRKRVASAYLENQRMNNRVTSQAYTAWDNIFTGNRYNLRLWCSEFKSRLRDCLRAEIRSIAWREGLSSGGGVIGLVVIFATMAFIAARGSSNTELLLALAVTVPRQIEMATDVLHFANGWNDIFAHWTRWGGVVANMRPRADPKFDDRIQFDHIVLRDGKQIQKCSTIAEALQALLASPTGRINLRGGNGAGKSSLLASLKSKIRKHAFYWPTGDRLSFEFARGALLSEAGYGEDITEEGEDDIEDDSKFALKAGFSSGERMLKALQEIADHTDDAIYLFDEWDANLDPINRAKANKIVDQLGKRARVIEISHRDQDQNRRSTP